MSAYEFGKSSTHHGQNCPDYNNRDTLFLRERIFTRPNQENVFYIMSLILYHRINHTLQGSSGYLPDITMKLYRFRAQRGNILWLRAPDLVDSIEFHS